MKQDLEARSTDNARLSAQLAQVHKDSQAEISRLSSQVDELKTKLLSDSQTLMAREQELAAARRMLEEAEARAQAQDMSSSQAQQDDLDHARQLTAKAQSERAEALSRVEVLKTEVDCVVSEDQKDSCVL